MEKESDKEGEVESWEESQGVGKEAGSRGKGFEKDKNNFNMILKFLGEWFRA